MDRTLYFKQKSNFIHHKIMLQALLVLVSVLIVSHSWAQKSPVKKELVQNAFNYPTLDKKLTATKPKPVASFQPAQITLPDKIFPQKYYHRARFAPNGFPLEMKLFAPFDERHAEKTALELLGRIQSEFGHPEHGALFDWRVEIVQTDELNTHHIFLREYYKNVPIYNNEAVLHAKDQHFYHFNAQWQRLEGELSADASLQGSEAFERVKKWFFKQKGVAYRHSEWIPDEANKGELWIYSLEEKAHLVWKFSYMPDAMHRWEVFLDAHTGRIIDYYQNMCSAHNHEHCAFTTEENAAVPPSITSGTDLNGVNRSLNTYQIGGQNFMIDATREMFNAQQSNLPNDPVGAIWTIDANGGFPGNGNWAPQQLTSRSNVWNNPSAVSAHFNAGRAYAYFEDVFGRNSINGRGGNVISFVDVREQNGAEMDNAFWNGIAIFYGNGNFAFQKPLASALDVAGHEMSHGVIQNTTNLEYRNESGALNESFADVFGVMIDRDDWLVGEEVVNPNVFRGGALRNMADPHNGGRSLNDPGYQPRHYDERYTGSDDNGGVHINSGIPNFAFFKIATALGKSQAEQIFYRALTAGYLTRSSRFIDFRSAIARSAEDLFGSAAATVCHRACDEVGIPGSPNQGDNDYQNDLPLNPGEEYLLASDPDLADLYLLGSDGNTYLISERDLGSKPSVTDNGQEIVYIGADSRMHYVFVDYSGAEPVYNDFVLESTPQWSYAAFSKDGSKLAAVRNVDENILFVYDFVSERWEEFELFNPSYTEGIATGEVRYADVLEWDYSGEFIMYDAFNNLISNDGRDISFWDIGFIKVWDKQRNDFTDGSDIQKLFTALDEGTSIGNPSFSKNSPYIIAFDYIDNTGNYLVAANLESGDANIILENDRLFYPNYNSQDNLIAFDARGFSANYDIDALPMKDDKINPSSQSIGLVNSARWGVFLSAGERELTSNSELDVADFSVYPNPASQEIFIESNSIYHAQIEMRDILGRKIGKYLLTGGRKTLSLAGLESGWYLLSIKSNKGEKLYSFIKQ